MLRVAYSEVLAEFTRILLREGFRPDRAELCARLFADASRDGVPTHGLNRFPGFIDFVRKGLVDAQAEPALVERVGLLERWDGRGGPGPLNAWFCMDRAIALARENAMGCAALRNTNHWMRAGNYGLQAAEAGCIGLCWTNTVALMPPWGARAPRLGNNPMVIALPGPDGPVLLDMAMTQFSQGKLLAYHSRGETLPVEGGFDRDGRPTRDPAAVLDSRRPMPIGYWKGSGLALMLDMVAALLSGGQATHEISRPEHETRVSQLFIAFDLRRLAPETAQRTVREVLESLHSAEPAEGAERPTYPGERMLRTRRESLERGVPVDPAAWQRLKTLQMT
jgi:3-dehydro-L-gulonate 2-dehydrogenase